MIRGDNQPDFADPEVAFVTWSGAHLGHGLREALLREAAASQPAHAPGVVILDKDGSVRSVTDQARFWLEQSPATAGPACSCRWQCPPSPSV